MTYEQALLNFNAALVQRIEARATWLAVAETGEFGPHLDRAQFEKNSADIACLRALDQFAATLA